MKQVGSVVLRVVAGLGAIIGAVAAAAGGWILYSALGINHHMPLPLAIRAERKRMVGRSVLYLSSYVDTSAPGRPLMLLHSINAAASSYEMRPIFEHYRGTRPVYALDLPGFGFSERSDRPYAPDLYKEAILDFMKTNLRQKADVIALSLSSEFAARAALQQPDLFHSLVLISPTGFTPDRPQRAAGKQEKGSFLMFDLWSQALYDLIVTRQSIRYFLSQSFEGPVPEEMIDYSYRTAHQPNARYAPLAFISGKLFSPDIRQNVYARLLMPVLVLYDKDNFVGFEMLPELVTRRENWHAERIIPTRGLPQFEQMDQTAQALDRFWQHIEESLQISSEG